MAIRTIEFEGQPIHLIGPMDGLQKALTAGLHLTRRPERMCLIIGEQGMGKTVGSRLFCAQHPDAVYIQIPPASVMRPGRLLQLLETALDLPIAGAPTLFDRLHGIIAELRQRPRMMVFDNANRIRKYDYIDMLRYVHDEAGARMAFVSIPSLEYVFTSYAEFASNRGPGGALDVAGARIGVGRIAPLSASVEIPSLSYQETMVLIEGFFVAGYESTPALTSQFANRVVSSQRMIDYRALGAAPRMQEWFDEIEPKVFNTLTPFPVTVRDWEASVTIPLSELQADKLGQYAMRVQQMGAFAKQHPDELLAALIVAAETTLCYDGQDLCDTDHSEGSSGTQSNFLTTGYDDDDLTDINLSLGAAIAAFNGFKDDRGQYLRIGSRPDAVFDVLVRPAVLHLFRTLATADVISGTSNGWKGRIRPMALPELTVASDFYVAYVEDPVKPFIVQFQNEPSALKTLGPDSEYATLHGRAFFSTQGNYTVAPGDWRYIIKLQKA